MYRRPGFNCVVKQLRFWLFKVDCEFKDCDLRMLRIGHTCVIYTVRVNKIFTFDDCRTIVLLCERLRFVPDETVRERKRNGTERKRCVKRFINYARNSATRWTEKSGRGQG